MGISSRTLVCLLAASASAAYVSPAVGQAISNAFTYQGRLTDGGNVANGAYDFQFKLFDAATGGAQQGATVSANDLAVASGLFTARLDFADQFNGSPRWLQIEVRPGASTGAYTALNPRVELTSAPYASQARSAFALDAADGSPANALFVDNSGNVGIGTTAPQTSLHVMSAASGEGVRIQGPLSTPANLAYLSFANSTGTALGYVGDGSSGDNTIFLGAYNGDVSLVTSGGGRVLTATAAGNLNLGTGSGDYRHLRIGGGNSDGFIYGSFARLGDGIHMGYNYYADAAGNNQIIHPDGGTSRLSVSYGYITLATAAPFGGEPITRFQIDPTGNAWFAETASVKTLQIRGGSDLAEPFDVAPAADSAAKPAPGMVVVIDPANPGELKLSGGAYDTKVAGVISGANGLPTGMVMRSQGQAMADGEHPIALSGRVWCYVDASVSAVEPGDLLTTSDVPGHAMKATDAARAGGAIIGKAMTGLKDGRGMVLVLVNLQ